MVTYSRCHEGEGLEKAGSYTTCPKGVSLCVHIQLVHMCLVHIHPMKSKSGALKHFRI